MSRNFDITSANCSLVLTVEELFESGIDVQMFATDQAFSQGDSQVAETRMGVDGKMVAGYTPNIKEVTIMLEAASPSYESFAQVYRASETNKRLYRCTLVATSPSLGIVWTWSNGVMYSGQIVPAAKQVFDPTTWVFHFSDLDNGSTGKI